MIEICGKKINPKSILELDIKSEWREMPVEDYHADKTAVNSSSLKYATKSEFAFAHVFWGPPKEPTDAMKFGTLVHMAILEPAKFKENYVVEPYFEGPTQDGKMSPNSKVAKEKRAAWRSELPSSAVVVTEEEQAKIFSMIDSVLSHPTASVLLKDGRPELIGYWKDKTTGINLRMMADFMAFNLGVLADLKTCQDSEWEAFRKTGVEGLQYFHQMAMYVDGTENISKKKVENKVWIAVENKYPFETRVHEVDEKYDYAGNFQYRENLNKVKKAIDLNHFPQGQLESVKGEPTPWFYKKYELKGAFNDVTR
jgi:hypothetical protein